MELMWPIALIICFILAFIICFAKNRKKVFYTNGKKIANTQFIKETDYYKLKIKKYIILSNLIKVLSILCIIITGILISRPITVEEKSEEKLNRDIIIGLDISTSECEVNLELVKQFKEILPDIEGDRIGIVLFNTAPVVYCPLTDDYDYIEDCLDEIQYQLEIVVNNGGTIPYFSFSNADESSSIYAFWYGGTIDNNAEKGSSLVGDGLAGTLYSFPDLKTNTERTRIIIFATDNDVAGTETVSLEDACTLCKKYNVILYAYCPTVKMNSYTSTSKISSYKNAVEKNADGKFYNGDIEEMAKSIVDEIKNTKTSNMTSTVKTYVTDHPETFFVFLILIFLVLIIIEKRVKL